MTKAELLKHLVSSEDLNAAIVDLVAYIKQNRTTLDKNLATANGKIATLIADDANKSVRTIANEELAAQLIPESAKEALDTLQEIAAWIQQHPDDAAAMNQAIQDLQALVGELPETTSATTVVGYITSEIAALAQQIGNMSWKTINGDAITGTGNIDLPCLIEVSNIKQLTDAQCEKLRVGDMVAKVDSTGKHTYTVTYKGDTGLCLTYGDCENIETVAYEKKGEPATWQWDSTDVNNINGTLHEADFDTIGVPAAKAIVAAAIALVDTVYSFISYSADGQTEYARGTAVATGAQAVFGGEDYMEIEVKTNTVAEWVGRKFFIVADATFDGVTKYDLYDANGQTVGVKVAVTANA